MERDLLETRKLAENSGIYDMANLIKKNCEQIRTKYNDKKPSFLMIIQDNEDNIFDQFMLLDELEKQGVKTYIRTFSELKSNTENRNGRLWIENKHEIDCVYYRTGYQLEDFIEKESNKDITEMNPYNIRSLIETCDVAINATVAQQIATSKKVQLMITNMSIEELSKFGINEGEAQFIKPFLTPMQLLSEEIATQIDTIDNSKYVLKNQGEGGNNCTFGSDIPSKVKSIPKEEYNSWVLMKKIDAIPSKKPIDVMRNGKLIKIEKMVSEIGIFTGMVSYESEHIGYLIRSKGIETNEAGIHSGSGILDSLSLT